MSQQRDIKNKILKKVKNFQEGQTECLAKYSNFSRLIHANICQLL